MRKAVAWLFLVPVLLVHADDADSDEAFFEFLGSFSDVDDTWLDPLLLEDVELPADEDGPQANEREENDTASDVNDES